jgi:hypothetical protein
MCKVLFPIMRRERELQVSGNKMVKTNVLAGDIGCTRQSGAINNVEIHNTLPGIFRAVCTLL